ncbi:MAG: biotin--[acetyl-CoA-carboxylase] ligase [Candidatus Parabeggiatoa sp. nov. 3]|nr:MAG: biotin--[acetyl-CoA-carboxylase] ligase [Gammaproteobacteria bacterium]RKZ66891.1 MAG: biotin--[acetyl-CoA-carboxylase] ligase [Gammaproteobacteria bacterium]RKZ85286.1 MAG: biotin--[acetyl-CoA-carboxylase] ligase [Gammaproteobacteria bacterium]
MYYRVLQILADGQVHTAEQLNQYLSLGLGELEQALNTLITYGIRFHSKADNTYQLTEALELLERSRILAALPRETRQLMADLEIHSVLDSTNRHLLTQQHLTMPCVCLAEYQTAGRGRQGRQWVSPYASGLCLSLKQRYVALNEPLGGLSIALGVTVARALHRLGASDVGLKWPNDVLWRGRKLAGLLLESRWRMDCEIVIGIGINVKMPPVETPNIAQPWVDLYTVLGHSISRNALAAMLIEQCLQTLISYPQVGLAAFRPDWHDFDLSYGHTVTLSHDKRGERVTVTGTALGIDEQGALLLEVGNTIQRYVYGEVSLRL